MPRRWNDDDWGSAIGLTLVAIGLTLVWTPWVLVVWGAVFFFGNRFGA